MGPPIYPSEGGMRAIPKLYTPIDPLGEYENDNTIYTLTVYVPEQIPSRYAQWIEKRSNPVDYSSYNPATDHKLGGNPDFLPPEPPSCIIDRSDLKDMTSKVIKIKAYKFPLELRCSHVRGKLGEVRTRECKEGCYIFEVEGKRGKLGPGWTCERKDCEGHRWRGWRKKDEYGRWCFGKKGSRIICIEAE
jgi:hypothetical protein